MTDSDGTFPLKPLRLTEACRVTRAHVWARLLAAFVLVIPGIGNATGWTLIGPGSSRVDAVAISPADPSIVVATRDRYLVVSRDAGISWQFANAFYGASCQPGGFGPPAISQLAIAGGTASRIFISGCSGVYFSDDLGESWGGISPPAPQAIYLLLPNPANVDQLVLRSGPSLFLTTDRGRTWQQTTVPSGFPGVAVDWVGSAYVAWGGISAIRSPFGQSNGWVSAVNGLPAAAISVIATSGPALIAATSSGLFRSTDHAASWTQSSAPTIAYTGLSAGLSLGQPNALLYAWSSDPRVFRSTDLGITWSELPQGTGQSIGVDALIGWADNGTGNNIVVSGSQGSQLVLGNTNQGLVRSTDGGNSFSAIPTFSGLPAIPSSGIVANKAQGDALFDQLGMYTADGGTTWSTISVSNAGPGVSLSSVLWSNGPSLFVAVSQFFALESSQSILRSTDGGSTWNGGFKFVSTIDPGEFNGALIAFVPTADRTGYLLFSATCLNVSCQAVVNKSTDGGTTWGPTTPVGGQITAIVPVPGTSNYLAGFSALSLNNPTSTLGGLYSSDDGVTWRGFGSGLPQLKILSLAAKNAAGSPVFASLATDTLPTVYVSNDAGNTWQAAAAGLPAARVAALAVDPASPSTVYAGINGFGVYRSIDAGATWTDVSAGLYDTSVADLKFDGVLNGRLYVATNSGIFALDGPSAPATATAVEYFYPAFGYYFETAFPDEIAALDRGVFPGWSRTGQTFAVDLTVANMLNPVCRFFSTAFAPKSSHFYTPYTLECSVVRSSAAWQYEGVAFYLRLRGIDGACPSTDRPLYRIYNNGLGGAPNHRYTVENSIVDQMISMGWVFEGDAVTRVFACVPN
jgi:photosystem II stability/assembly factor-like uncharacterized protein